MWHSPVLLLLRRDLRLHWGGMILPAAMAFCVSLASLKADQSPMGFVFLSVWVALLVPHALHLREEHYQTLGALRALPVTPAHIVGLRLLEALLAILVVLLVHLAMTLVHGGLPALKALHDWRSPELLPVWLWLLLLFVFLPLPVTLRWGVKGWITGLVSLFTLAGALAVLPNHVGSPVFWHAIGQRTGSILSWLDGHPLQHTLGLALLCLACLSLAAQGYRRRDA